MLRLHLRAAGTATGITASSRYVVVSGPGSAAGTAATLIDERMGTRTRVVYPGCWPVALGEPWLVFSCAPSYNTMRLYSLAGGGWRSVNVGLGVGWGPVSIGTHWIKMQELCPAGGHCCNAYAFQNLATGNTVRDPTNATTHADLDVPALARRLCKPLRVPQVAGNLDLVYAAVPGALTFEGRFVISSSGLGGADGFLERCGSRLHEQIGRPNDVGDILAGPPFAANSHMVVWQSGRHQLAGVLLPSLREFVIPLPAAINTESNGPGFPGEMVGSPLDAFCLPMGSATHRRDSRRWLWQYWESLERDGDGTGDMRRRVRAGGLGQLLNGRGQRAAAEDLLRFRPRGRSAVQLPAAPQAA